VEINGKWIKIPTSLGVGVGIYVEARKDYVVTLYNKEAQRYIVDRLIDILGN